MGKTIEKESDIRKQIETFLNNLPGCFAVIVHVGGVNGWKNHHMKGCPDILFTYKGRMGWFETKTEEKFKKFFSCPGNHEMNQREFHYKLKDRGGAMGAVVCSSKAAVDYFMEHFFNRPL